MQFSEFIVCPSSRLYCRLFVVMSCRTADVARSQWCPSVLARGADASSLSGPEVAATLTHRCQRAFSDVLVVSCRVWCRESTG